MTTILFIIAGVCCAGVLGIAGFLLYQKLGKSEKAAALRENLVQKRKLANAKKAYDKGDFERAIKQYKELEMFEEAANVAARINEYERAAQLFKRAGNERRAAHFYEKAGQQSKAANIREGGDDKLDLSSVMGT